MGLFIGASILTILELFDYIYEVRFGITHGEVTTGRCPSAQNRGVGRGRPLSSLSVDIVCHQSWHRGGRDMGR